MGGFDKRAFDLDRWYGPRPPQDGSMAFMGEGLLSGKPMLKIVAFLGDQELEEASRFDSTVTTLTGRPVADVAREEIARRKNG